MRNPSRVVFFHPIGGERWHCQLQHSLPTMVFLTALKVTFASMSGYS